MDRSSKQKINKEAQVLNDTLDEMDIIDIFRTFHPNAECCSHALQETNSLRRTVQIVECSLLHRRPKAESPLSQGPQPAFVKIFYTPCVCVWTHHSKFLETYINQGKYRASLVAQRLKRLPAMRETWVQSLGREDPLEKEMATHSSILAWRIPWTEEPGGLQSTGSQRVGHNWATSH